MSDSGKLTGVVKWFNDAKGFGFIEHNTGQDVFVHYSVIQSEGFKTLKDGEEVSYEIKEGPKGLHAVKVFRTADEIAASVGSTSIQVSDEDDEDDTEDDDDLDQDTISTCFQRKSCSETGFLQACLDPVNSVAGDTILHQRPQL